LVERKAAAKALTNKTCRQISDLVFDYLNEKLRPATKRDFEQHLSICPDCLSFLNTYKKAVEVTGSVKVDQLPPKVRENILAFLRKRIPRIGVILFFVATNFMA
jgi:putative zinc finger protein